ELDQKVRQSILEHPIKFHMNSITFDGTDRVINHSADVNTEFDKVLKVEMLDQAKQLQEIYAVTIIIPALTQIVNEHNIQIDNLMRFVVDNPFIPIEREQIYAEGLYAFFTNNYLLALHLLIPQLENSIRHILQNAGDITATLNLDLLQDEYPLNIILRRQKLEDVLGKDIVFDLQGLLTERASSNFRNLLAHGLMKPSEFNQPRTVYLCWLILKLCYSHKF
ncbi:MAG TPA: DUF4209 domain-containing protein, partial [Phototrophicaceae bacterium]|nr:DUF4209 domain-containing protein [Phototrophicaceae bacterium]